MKVLVAEFKESKQKDHRANKLLHQIVRQLKRHAILFKRCRLGPKLLNFSLLFNRKQKPPSRQEAFDEKLSAGTKIKFY